MNALRRGSVTPARVARVAATALAATVVVALAGQAVTDLGPWYRGLRQPVWKPPDAWFGPAWSIIFALVTAAATRWWLAASGPAARRRLLAWFAVNALLHVGWSWLFFTRQRPDWALAEVALLWASIAVLVWQAGREDRLAGALLVPYLLWVSFAASINWGVVRLNGPF